MWNLSTEAILSQIIQVCQEHSEGRHPQEAIQTVELPDFNEGHSGYLVIATAGSSGHANIQAVGNLVHEKRC